jgi:hypothetical protein
MSQVLAAISLIEIPFKSIQLEKDRLGDDDFDRRCK